MINKIIMPLVCLFFFCACSTFKRTINLKKKPQITTVAKTDSVKTGIGKLRKYTEIISPKAITYKGVFKVHELGEKYYFELPDSIFDRDILVVNRISKAATGIRPQFGALGYAGDEIGRHVIQFSKGPNHKVFIKRMSYIDVSNDSTANGMFRSVSNSNVQPIIASFDATSLSPDSAGILIDMSDYLNGDNDLLFFSAETKKLFGLTGIQKDRSYTIGVNVFPINLEIKTVKTYARGEGFSTYELNSSVVLLPEKPMKPRYADQRVGYFGLGFNDFDASQAVKPEYMILRWKLEPKKEDVEKYKKGELVEPIKPIIFYIDPNTPKKWVKYLIQGVNDWQAAFEQAGFKNAIYAREAPTKLQDSTWSLEDARFSAIVYKPSPLANASGPNIHDPRSGEILESHINWYHQVMSLLHNWYMIQAGAVDSRARKMVFDDELMGQLIRFVSSHEVGHTLGLQHNFGSSSTIPVDSLRSKKYVEENGFCPSIMDYARFNYVAQPEDGITEKGIMPRIGIYDKWAIEWGYRWFTTFENKTEEKLHMSKWIDEKLKGNHQLWFGEALTQYEPRCLTEDVGDDAMKASRFGIKNLKRVLPNLISWTKEPGGDYTSLASMKEQVWLQYKRYLQHVISNVGGIMIDRKSEAQTGTRLAFVSSKKQKDAIQFLQEELFTTPEWLLNRDVYALVGKNSEMYNLFGMQSYALGEVCSHYVLLRLFGNEATEPGKVYTVNQLFNDLENGIWKELESKRPVDLYRRNLQRLYAERLIALENWKSTTHWSAADNLSYSVYNFYTDVYPIIRQRMSHLITKIDKVLPLYKDNRTVLHLEDIRRRFRNALQGKLEEKQLEESKSKNSIYVSDFHERDCCFWNNRSTKGCWSDELLFNDFIKE